MSFEEWKLDDKRENFRWLKIRKLKMRKIKMKNLVDYSDKRGGKFASSKMRVKKAQQMSLFEHKLISPKNTWHSLVFSSFFSLASKCMKWCGTREKETAIAWMSESEWLRVCVFFFVQPLKIDILRVCDLHGCIKSSGGREKTGAHFVTILPVAWLTMAFHMILKCFKMGIGCLPFTCGLYSICFFA